MKLMAVLLFVLGLAGIVASGEGTSDTNVEIVTGARTWRMADGTTKRLRFTGFAKNDQYGLFQTGNAAPGGKPLSAFAAEEQKVFTAFRNGSLKLATTPGICMNPDFPSGKLPGWMKEDPQFWLGERRTWENSNGKRVEARLICLTDEDVSLLIGETVARIPLKELGAADLTYLAHLKGGGRRTYSDNVEIGGLSWDNGHSYTVSISGEKYAVLAKRGSRFEEALKAVLLHVSSKLDSSKWELASFSETRCPPPGGTHSFDVQQAAPDKEDRPYSYIGEFHIKESAATESRRIWPLLTSPKSWPGATTLQIHAMADGSVLEAEPTK